MGDGPYRVGNHSPLNVWCEPGQSTTEQVCMATSPRWAGRIVAALNEQDARSVGEQAVSDAVASAHLSGVDLPADWVVTLGKVARGEVTADDAVQTVVDGSLRDQIVAELATHSYLGSDSCDCGTWRADKLWDVDWADQWRMHVAESIVDFRVAPMLAAKDRDVEQIRIRLTQTLNLPHSRTLDQLIDDVSEVFSGWVRMACEIGGLRRELKSTEATRQQYVEERDEALDDVERLRSALSKALADLVVRRQALANVLGVTDAGGASGYYRMIQDVADVRAEVERLRKANEVMANALQGSAYDTKDVLQLRADLGEARAELAAVKSKRMWRTAPISGVMHLVPDGDGRRESVCGLVGSTTWQPAVDGNARCLECERWQLDTESTEQPRCARCEHYEHQSSCATDCMACPPCTSTFTIAGRTHRCALRGSHKESLHLNNIRKHDTVWDDDQADSAPVTPTELRAVYDEPGDVQYEYDEDDNPTDPSVGWDLTFGCRVSFGHDSDGYRATVSISDQTQRDGIAVRGVTRDQIRAYAYQLIRLTEVIEGGTQ